MEEKKRLIAFCIIHTNRLDCTKRCISAIERHTNVKYCIKLLRQGYTNEEAEMYFKELEKRENFEIIRLKKNVGPPAGRKILLEKTETPLIMTLDNDIYVTEGWLEPILEILQNNEDVGLVGIPRHKFNGEFGGLGGRKIKNINNILHIEKPKVEKTKSFVFVDDACGTIILRKEVKSDFTYDPQFLIGFGDLDRGLQLLTSKWKKVVCLKSRVIHDHVGAKNLGYVARRMNYPEISRSYAKFRKKWELRLPWKKHVMLKYVYPFILPQLYKMLHTLKDMVIRRKLSFLSRIFR